MFRIVAFVITMLIMGRAMAAEGYDIIPVIGQSNATDFGAGPFTPKLQNFDNRIRQLGRLGESNMQVVPVGRTSDGVVWGGLQFWGDEPDLYRLGFALPFARLYARHLLQRNRTVLIVPAAKGGSNIETWLGEGDSVLAPMLYPDTVARIRHALALPGENRVVAVLFHQGEANLRAGMPPPEYRAKRTLFLSRLRTDIPGTYWIITAPLAATFQKDNPYKIHYQKIIRAVAEQDGRSRSVDVGGLSTNDFGPDDPHFTAESQQILALRMFNAFAQRGLD